MRGDNTSGRCKFSHFHNLIFLGLLVSLIYHSFIATSYSLYFYEGSSFDNEKITNLLPTDQNIDDDNMKETKSELSLDHYNRDDEDFREESDYAWQFLNDMQHIAPSHQKDLGDLISYNTVTNNLSRVKGSNLHTACSLLLSDEEQLGDFHAEDNDDAIILEEDQNGPLCQDWDSPFSSLLQMFTTQLVISYYNANSNKKRNVIYRHNCDKIRSQQKTSSHKQGRYLTIQQYLMQDISFNEDHDDFVLFQQLHDWDMPNMCKCLMVKMNSDDNPSWYNDCLFQPLPTHKDDNNQENDVASVTMFHFILPTMSAYVKAAARLWRDDHNTEIDDNVEEAVILLSCADESCSGSKNDSISSYSIPLYIYAIQIPKSIPKISIIISPSCVLMDNCPLYGQALFSFLQQFYPRSLVQLDIITSSAKMYAKIINAAFTISPPSIPAIFPSLLNTNDGNVIIYENRELYPWLPQILSSLNSPSINLLSQESIQMIKYENMDMDDFLSFLKQDPPTSSIVIASDGYGIDKIMPCQYLRGRVGKWIKGNLQFQSDAQYPFPLKSKYGVADSSFMFNQKKNRHKIQQQYRLPTTWKWIETVYPNSCSLQRITLLGLCDVLRKMKVERIFFIGDVVALQQTLSFWKLLEDLPEHPAVSSFSTEDSSWTTRHKCPSTSHFHQSSTWEFELSFIRNDRLNDEEESVLPLNEGYHQNCEDADCNPWINRYIESSSQEYKRTLLIASTGTIHLKLEHFQKDFDAFLSIIDRANRLDDIVIFTSSSPRHEECATPFLTPYSDYNEYKNAIPRLFTSTKAEMFNEYVYNTLQQRLKSDNRDLKPHVEMLDIFPMTALRPDGHLGGVDCEKCGNRNICSECVGNCLEYALPGPVDWWTHLLYTQLLDLSNT